MIMKKLLRKPTFKDIDKSKGKSRDLVIEIFVLLKMSERAAKEI